MHDFGTRLATRLHSATQKDFVRACGAVFLLNATDASITTVAPPICRRLAFRWRGLGFCCRCTPWRASFPGYRPGGWPTGITRGTGSAQAVLLSISLAL